MDNFATILIVAVVIVFLLLLGCKVKGCKKCNENYCCGGQLVNPVQTPEFPTIDHLFTNNYTRYNYDSDFNPFSPYSNYPGAPTYY